MSPDEDIYDLDLDLDQTEEDDPDAVMKEAVASLEARQEEGSREVDVEVATGALDSRNQDAGPDRVFEMQEEIIALRERSLRALADLENFRRRSEKERDELMRFAGFEMLREFLDVVDNLERALASGGALEDLTLGVEMIHRQLLDVLRRFGVERVDSEGQAFDPAVHEAVAKVEDPAVSEPTVVDEMQSGFVMHDRLLRPAIVRVAMPAEVPEIVGKVKDEVENLPTVEDDLGTEIGGDED